MGPTHRRPHRRRLRRTRSHYKYITLCTYNNLFLSTPLQQLISISVTGFARCIGPSLVIDFPSCARLVRTARSFEIGLVLSDLICRRFHGSLCSVHNGLVGVFAIFPITPQIKPHQHLNLFVI